MSDDDTMCAEQAREDEQPPAHGRVHTCTQDQHRKGTPHQCWCGTRWVVGARVELT